MVQTAKERELEFRGELAELIKKYDAEFHITDDRAEGGMQSGIVMVTIPGVWDTFGNLIFEFSEFRL